MGGFTFGSTVAATVQISETINETKAVAITQDVNLTGVTATALALSDVVFANPGDGVTAETFTETQIDAANNIASSLSKSIAAYQAGGGTPTFSIGDVLWADLDEDGVQDPGEPTVDAGAVVVLLEDADGDGTFDDVVASDTTDALGRYGFTGLEAGDYVVQFPGPGTVTFNGGQPLTGFTAANVGDSDAIDSDADPVTGRSAAVTVGPSTSAVDAGYVAAAAVLPDFAITKTADLASVSAAGEVITYTIEVTNTGDAALEETEVTDAVEGADPSTTLTGGFTGDDGNGLLDPDETWIYSDTYAVTQDDIDANGGGDGAIDNVVTASFVDQFQNTVVRQANASVPIVQIATLAVDKVVLGVANPPGGLGGSGFVNEAGDVINYEVIVENAGEMTLTGVSIVDPLAGIEAVIGSLAPGETGSVLGSYTVTQDDIDNNGGGDGFIDNTAMADSDQTDPPVTDSEAVPIANLAIDKQVSMVGGSEITMAGDVITYVITVENTAAVDLTDVTVTDPLSGLNDMIGDLAPGEVVEVETSYTVTQADIDSNGTVEPDDQQEGAIDNTAIASSTETGPRTAGTSVPIQQLALINVTKSVLGITNPDGSPAASIVVDEVDDTIAYTIAVTNTGNVTLADVAVLDPLNPLDATGPIVVGTLAPGETASVPVTYTVTQADLDDPDGRIDNTATARGEAPGGDPDDPGDDITDSDSAAVPIQGNADIAIDKTVVAVANPDGSNGGGFVNQVGDVITYAIEVTNPGTVSLTDINVEDSRLTTNLVFQGGDTDADDALDPGETWTFSGSSEVTGADLAANGSVDNTATVRGEAPGGDPNDPGDDVTDSDSASVPVVVGVDQLNVVFIIDASGSTDETWQFYTGGDVPPEFEGSDGTQYGAQQNPFTPVVGFPPRPNAPADDATTVNDAGDIIDAEIAAYKNLTESLLDAVEAVETDTGQNIQVDVAVIKTFAGGAVNAGVFDPESNKAGLFAELENTGSNTSTDLGGPMQRANEFFSTSARQDPDDLNVLYFLSDGVADNILNSPSIRSQVEALDALDNAPIREAWLVPNDEGASSANNPRNDPFSQVDNTGGVETLEEVSDLQFDYLMT